GVWCRHQAHGRAVAAHAHVVFLVIDARQCADRLHETAACRERPGPEVRARTVAEHAPILDALGLMELLRADPVGHAHLLVTEHCRESLPQLSGEAKPLVTCAATTATTKSDPLPRCLSTPIVGGVGVAAPFSAS